LARHLSSSKLYYFSIKTNALFILAEIKFMETKDCNGNLLQDGDAVVVNKTLDVKGSPLVIKKGTKVKGIRLTDDPQEVDCKVNGSRIVLRTEFLKKK
jgi:protein PhnA